MRSITSRQHSYIMKTKIIISCNWVLEATGSPVEILTVKIGICSDLRYSFLA
jgi:hypothetical protein